MDPALQRKDEVRLRLLQVMYRKTEGRIGRSVQMNEELAREVGASLDETVDAAEYLKNMTLLQRKTLYGEFVMLQPGILEAEESIRYPNRKTEHFSQMVVNNMTNNFGSNNVVGSIQNGGAGNTAAVNQIVTNTITQRVVEELREKVATLPPEQHDEVNLVIDQIESAIEKGPKAFAAIRMLVTGLGTYFPHLIPWLSTQADLVIGSLDGMLGA